MYYCIYFWMVALFILTPIYFYTLISVSFYIQALYYKMTKDKAHCLSNSLSHCLWICTTRLQLIMIFITV